MMFGWKKTLAGIPEIKTFSKLYPVAGHSKSNKYRVKTKCGRDVLLILGGAADIKRMEDEVEWNKYLIDHNIATNRVIDFGTYNSGQGCYMVLTWIAGKEVASLLYNKASKDCAQMGTLAGKLLREIHSVVPESFVHKPRSLQEEIEACIAEYSKEDGLIDRYPSMETFIQFLDDNKSYAVQKICPTLLHGDFHAKNLIYSDGAIYAIDWDYGRFGNPVDDFVRNIISAEMSCHFASALINSYYNNDVPDDFWLLLALYTAIHELRITKYEFEWSQKNISFVDHQHSLVLREYFGMKSLIPKYYTKCKIEEDTYEY